MCWSTFIYFLIYPISVIANGLQIGELHTNEANNITDCVIKVIEQIQWEMSKVDVSIINGNDLLIIPTLQNIQGVRFISRKFQWDTNTTSNGIYIIMSKDYKELERGLNEAEADFFWNTEMKFIIVIHDINEHLSNLTHLLLSHNIFNVSVLGKVNNDYVIYTFNSKSDSCNRPEALELFSECSQITEKVFKMRPFRGFRGCTINVVLQNSWPFVNNESILSKGLEQYLFTLFEENQGIKIKQVEYVQTNNSENVATKNTLQTMLEKLRLNEYEVAAGGFTLLNSESSNYYSFAYPLVIDNMALIARRTDFLRMWQAVLRRNYMTIIMFSIMFLIFSFIVTVMALFPRKKRDIILDILTVLGYFLEKTSVNVIKSGMSSTMFFLSMLLLVFIMPYILQAYLVSVTTNPVRIEQKKDSEEVYKNYQGIAYTEWRYKNLMQDLWDCGTKFECLSTVAKAEEGLLYYTIVSTTSYEYFKWMLADDRCNLQLYKITDSYVMLPRTIYFRRGSIFAKAYDKFFMKIMGGGLLTKYKKKLILEQRIQCRAVYRPVHVPQELHDYQDAFVVLIVGYCLSAAVFVFEFLAVSFQ